jgi:hypothetical protein
MTNDFRNAFLKILYPSELLKNGKILDHKHLPQI